MSPAIETKGLSYRAGDFALAGLDLRVPTGSVYGFLGPNGAGKSTTIRLMLGLLNPHAGSMVLLGEPVPARLPAVLSRIGFVPERPHLHRHLQVRESLQLHAAFHPRWDAARALELQREFALRDAQRLDRLSKGEMGKLLVLQALCQRPDLLVLDEPTDGLDPVVRRDVLGAILGWVADTNATVFISSHLVHEIERFCDWIGVLDRGRLVAELPMPQFRDGIKRLRVRGAPPEMGPLPFALLLREIDAIGGESWVVRGWQAPMASWFEGVGAALHDVQDLDLEEGFVELLRSARQERREVA